MRRIWNQLSVIKIKGILILILVVLLSKANGQNDTLYVSFDLIGTNYFIEARKHKEDPNEREYYPFDGGKIYLIPKVVGSHSKELIFSYRSFTPQWMDRQFECYKVAASILEEEKFKDNSWFDNTDYYEAIRTFRGADKIIYLMDETEIEGDSTYMVRVYFSFTTEE